MRTGLFCAIAGAKMPAEAETAPSAAADARSLRREIAIEVLPCDPALRRWLSLFSSKMIYQTHVTNKRMQNQWALAPFRKTSMSALVRLQSLSRLAITLFMNDSDSEMARSLSPRWS